MASGVGCGSQTASELAAEGPARAGHDDNPGRPATALSPPSDASTAKTTPYLGSPLCHPTTTSCQPDEDGYEYSESGHSCERPDAGDAASAFGSASGACRIAPQKNGGFALTCTDAVDAMGGDGASCETGSNCAAGFDCVVGDKGAKVCRHYCCGGTCKGHMSQNGGATFCDVQSLVDVPQKAPVCMPLKQCKLLGTGECTETESCAVVTENGATGCVTVGQQQVGASCDEDHCAASLTCLGQPGSRKCYKLCRINGNDCGAGTECEPSTVFKDAGFGTCQKP